MCDRCAVLPVAERSSRLRPAAGGRRPRRCISRLVLYQCTHAEVMSSRSVRVHSGPLRNGEPARVHSIFYSPIVVSASALSRASPAVPTDGIISASISVSVKCIAVYCDRDRY